ncbi:MAG: hypothetical protein AB2L07_19610 [Thermoanaerobaculaceae bacterium]
MPVLWLPLIARVEWRSERKAGQRPQAVLVGSERREVEEEHHWVEGPQVAGAALETVWIVTDDEGRRYRLRRREAGEATVEIDGSPSPGVHGGP